MEDANRRQRNYQFEGIFIMIKLLDMLDEDFLIEAGFEYVIRNRKKIKRLERKRGYKVINGKYKKMLADEILNRKNAQRNKKQKRSSKTIRNQKLSIAKRRSMGMKRRR